MNSVIVLFVMEMDEWIFSALEASNKKWTEHAADSESSSDSAAEKGAEIDEMQEEIAVQKEQITVKNRFGESCTVSQWSMPQ